VILTRSSAFQNNEPRLTRRGPERRLGLSLLEVSIYVGLLAVIMVPIGVVTTSFTRMNSEAHMLSQILERNRTCFQRLSEDIKPAIATGTTITNGGKTLLLEEPAVFSGAAPVAGGMIQYDLQAAADDPANALDDNGNGVADEFSLIRTNLLTGDAVVVASNLEGTGSQFVASGTGIQVTVVTMGKAHGATETTMITKSQVFFPKN
jgi:hypothetical protein